MFLPVTGMAQNQQSQNAAARPHGGVNTSVLVQGTTATGGTFNGVMKITNFAVQSGVLVAQGVVNGTLTDPKLSSGAPQTITNQPVAAPVAGLAATCSILNLTLGPLHLNLLGLVVDLNQVVLNITAQPGPGNLLGNLLCDVAGLLNGGGALSGILNQVTQLLNQILASL
jgi:hypothetical protein